MKKLTLFLHDELCSDTELQGVICDNKDFNLLSDCVNFCTENNLIDHTYVVQNEEDDEFNISISMQEIKSIYDQGECPEDLDFF